MFRYQATQLLKCRFVLLGVGTFAGQHVYPNTLDPRHLENFLEPKYVRSKIGFHFCFVTVILTPTAMAKLVKTKYCAVLNLPKMPNTKITPTCRHKGAFKYTILSKCAEIPVRKFCTTRYIQTVAHTGRSKNNSRIHI